MCLGSPKWSVSVPQTQAGQPITFEAYRGLWKQCYGSGQSGFNVCFLFSFAWKLI